MALYDMKCDTCGKPSLEAMPMESALKREYPPCSSCGGALSRVYLAPADHSENTFKAYYSEQLSKDLDGSPVYVKSRSEWYRLQKEAGVRPYESGMTEDRARRRAHEADRKRDRAVSDAMRKVFGD